MNPIQAFLRRWRGRQPRPAFTRSRDRYPEYPLHVVGESHHQRVLAELVAGSDTPGPRYPLRGAECPVVAHVMPDDANPYDAHAVRVEIDGRHVGHLGRDDARHYRDAYGAQGLRVKALIVGGWDDGVTTGFFGVRLDLSLE